MPQPDLLLPALALGVLLVQGIAARTCWRSMTRRRRPGPRPGPARMAVDPDRFQILPQRPAIVDRMADPRRPAPSPGATQ